LVQVQGDSITLSKDAVTTAYNLTVVRGVEMSRGRRSHGLLGAGVGFLLGSLAAYAVLSSGGSTALCDQSANQDALQTTECLGLSAAAGGLPGAGLGALIGTLIRSERWEPVSTGQLREGRAPGAVGSLRLTLQLAF
jgi:hypothetical protein